MRGALICIPFLLKKIFKTITFQFDMIFIIKRKNNFIQKVGF